MKESLSPLGRGQGEGKTKGLGGNTRGLKESGATHHSGLEYSSKTRRTTRISLA